MQLPQYICAAPAVGCALISRVNCGTGRAQTFNRVAVAVINAVHGTSLTLHDAVAKGLIEYIPFPSELAGKYQSFTEADLSKLREAGYPGEFMAVEQGVAATSTRSAWRRSTNR